MIQSAVTDVVCPTVATDCPDGFFHEVIFEFAGSAQKLCTAFAGFIHSFGQKRADLRSVVFSALIHTVPVFQAGLDGVFQFGVDFTFYKGFQG